MSYDENNEKVRRYFVYKDGEYFTQDEFEEVNEAIEYAKQNDCDEVELSVWSKRVLYNSYHQADRTKVVWRNFR